MNINGLLKVAEKNKYIPTQKRFSLDFSPPKKLPKTQVNPAAIRALIEKKDRERQNERANLISKAVESTKRDEINYKDRNGLRKAEQEHTEKCKKQWQKVQKDRREFIEHMNRAAEKRDQNKKARDAQEVIQSIKTKEQEKSKRKRKYETYTGSTETAKKVKYTPIAAPKVTDINELMRMAQKNAEEKSFGAIVNPIRELEKKQPAVLGERLLTQAEKKKLAEQEALAKRRDAPSIPRIPKIGQSTESHKTNKHKKLEPVGRKESSKPSKDKVKEKTHATPSSNHSSAGSSAASSSHRDKHEKPRDKKPHSEKDKPRTSHNGTSSSKSDGVSKASSAAQSTPPRKPPTGPVSSNGSLGKPQNGNVATQSMSSSAKDKLREEMAKKLAQLQKERQAEEEEERRKRLQAKKARLAEEEQLKKKLKALQQNRMRMDSEDEDDLDEDLDEYEDDFIDDGPIDDPYAKGYSEHIKEIFKYDKTKYRDIDEDDIEESSFARCMAEEARSARLGRQEDLEDMRKEAEENRRKASRSKVLEDLSKKLKQKKKPTLCPV